MIYIEPSFDIPEVRYEPGSFTLFIKGKSFSDNVLPLFDEINAFIDKEVAEKKPGVFNLEIELSYFNTASAKGLFDLFKKMELLNTLAVSTSVRWIYKEDDEEILEAGQQFKELLESNFELIKINE